MATPIRDITPDIRLYVRTSLHEKMSSYMVAVRPIDKVSSSGSAYIIFGLLTAKELSLVSRVSSTWKEQASHAHLWREALIQDPSIDIERRILYTDPRTASLARSHYHTVSLRRRMDKTAEDMRLIDEMYTKAIGLFTASYLIPVGTAVICTIASSSPPSDYPI